MTKNADDRGVGSAEAETPQRKDEFKVKALQTFIVSMTSGSANERVAAIKMGLKLFGDNPQFRQTLYLVALAGDGKDRGLFDEYAPVRKAAVEPLFRDTELSAEGVQALCVNLKHPESSIRRRAAECLGQQTAAPTLAWPYLVSQLSDADVNVRVAVIKCLSLLAYKKEATVQAMLDSAQHDMAALRAALQIDAEKAHNRRLGENLGTYLIAICKALATWKDSSVRVEVFLVGLCRSDSPRVQKEALAALQALGFDEIVSEQVSAIKNAETALPHKKPRSY